MANDDERSAEFQTRDHNDGAEENQVLEGVDAAHDRAIDGRVQPQQQQHTQR